MKALLIPGYATEARFSIFRGPRDAAAGFDGLHELINQRKAVAFRWGSSVTYSLIQSLSPFHWQFLYAREERLVHNERTQFALAQYWQMYQPTHIVAHSLGARLVMLTAHAFGVPPSVEKIITIQADCDPTFPFPVKDVQWENWHCAWDPSLLASSITHRKMRGGLTGMVADGFINKKVPLWRLPNLHMSSLRSILLRQELEK